MAPTPSRILDPGLRRAVLAAGTLANLARLLGLSPQAIGQWKQVPLERLLDVEKVTKIPRQKLRPELFRGLRKG